MPLQRHSANALTPAANVAICDTVIVPVAIVP